MPAASTAFIDALRRFADGTTSMADFEQVVRRAIGEGPRVVLYEGAEPDVVFSAELEAGFYLDMVVDEGSAQDPEEARHLAGTLAVLLEGSDQADTLLADLMTLARWKRKAIERLRAHVSGSHDREAFERFVARRHWSSGVKEAILHMSAFELRSLADQLESDDWVSIKALFRAA